MATKRGKVAYLGTIYLFTFLLRPHLSLVDEYCTNFPFMNLISWGFPSFIDQRFKVAQLLNDR